ncbi:alpha beta-hydrolase [Fusarium beomiforme]|uniref:Alpha beta-hydrolase n=1 Tax=Fusarium beomiforme TaxID=44412 RepID=A0A9P5AQF1_9HYPO|nr:alpha beta-hydrolase [Fusarium beomiforme]
MPSSFSSNVVVYANATKSIHYLTTGPSTGPLLIFLHGWPAVAMTWRPQLEAFSAMGFFVVAPDMPGYGKSTANKVLSDYSLEAIVEGMLALLADTGREQAVWVAHDWGCGVLWSLAATNPDVCLSIVNLVVPYRTLELGFDELMAVVNRDIYPEDKYPYGQWEYQVFYERHFEKATAWFDSDKPAVLRLLFSGKGNPEKQGQPGRTATVLQDGGWFGGIPKPPPKSTVPPGSCLLDKLPPEDVRDMEEDFERNSFFGPDAYYMNHKANRSWNLEHSKNGGVLRMPVLFIEAQFDTAADSAVNPKFTERMKQLCENLSFASIPAGHWVALEKPEETTATIARWLVETVPLHWPGPTITKLET